VGMFAPASARGLLSCRATKLQWHIFFATARGKRHEGAQECNDGDFLALHGTDLRLAALVLRAPLCPMPINAQGSIAIPASKSVDKTRMPRDLRSQIDAILPLVATNGRAPRENTTEGGFSRGTAGTTVATLSSVSRWACRAGMGCARSASAAPGAAHALADALRAIDDTAGRNEAAHPAGEGRQAPAIGARATEIAGANHLAVATDIEAGGLRQGRRSQRGRAAGDQRQQPVAQPSHRDAPQKTPLLKRNVSQEPRGCNIQGRQSRQF